MFNAFLKDVVAMPSNAKRGQAVDVIVDELGCNILDDLAKVEDRYQRKQCTPEESKIFDKLRSYMRMTQSVNYEVWLKARLAKGTFGYI